MVFFGEARGRTTPPEHGAHGEFKPHESARRVDARCRSWSSPCCRRSAGSSSCRSATTPSASSSWLASRRRAGRGSARSTSSGTWADDHMYAADGHRRRRRRRRHRRRLPRVPAQARVKAIEPAILANAWYYDQTVTDFMGGPGARRSRASAWFDAQRRRRRRQRRRRAVRATAGVLRKRPERLRARLRRRSSASASLLLLAWFVIVRGIRADGRQLGSRSSTDASCCRRRSSALVASSIAHGRTRRPDLRASLVGLARRASITGALSIWLLAAFDTGDAGFQFVSQHAWIEHVGHLVAPRRRRHLAVARRAHRRAVPAGDLRRSTRTTTRSRTSRGCCCSRPACIGVVPQPRPVRVLRLLRDRARADVLPHRRLGLRRPRLRRHASSSCSRCSARRSCSSASSPPCSSPADNGVGDDHLRPRRRSPSRPTFPTVDRRAGCSSPSPSPSPSRCRSSRCTRGCPTPTPRRRPPAR